ncbi:probable sentrin-specific protease 8 [Bradysia coprophila]|uniref:probable sentrin-specific protease 8 n=1 Tax=Bradysia coprophila TaxID=38358 RepID=UPI00187DD9EC|nr:probable sentrin-specific protease 8 [Bradysia coprophila]
MLIRKSQDELLLVDDSNTDSEFDEPKMKSRDHHGNNIAVRQNKSAAASNNYSSNNAARIIHNNNRSTNQRQPQLLKSSVNAAKQTSIANDATKTSSKSATTKQNDSNAIRKYHTELLKEEVHITDNIIGFWMEWLQRNDFKDNEEILFVPSVVQHLKIGTDSSDTLSNMDLYKKKFIFMPMNTLKAGATWDVCHWYLMIFSRSDNRFYVFNSNDNTEQVGKLNANNLRDCGLHVLTNAQIVAKHVITNENQSNPTPSSADTRQQQAHHRQPEKCFVA